MYSLSVFCSDGWWREVAITTPRIQQVLRDARAAGVRQEWSLQTPAHPGGNDTVRFQTTADGRLVRHTF